MFYLILVGFYWLLNSRLGLSYEHCVIDESLQNYAESGRLPNFVKPTKYQLLYMFDDSLKSYTGVVLIDISILKKTKVILLHSDKQSIQSVDASVVGKDGNYTSKNQIFSICVIPEQQFLVLRSEELVDIKSKVILTVKFSANVSDIYEGIYSVDHPTKKKQDIKTIATFFEISQARLAFPCFDEPLFKATFELEITYPTYYTAISNTYLQSENIFEDRKVTKFQETPPMSTYLLSFIIFDFKSKTIRTTSGINVSIWLPEEYINFGSFALSYSLNVIKYLENVLDYRYPFQKLDIAAIIPLPLCISTEHLGLISATTALLFIDKKESGIKEKLDFSIQIGHSIAHQWFGNLVTTAWWTDVWMKEGISIFLSYMAVENIFPEYRAMNYFKNQVENGANSLDQTAKTHPIYISTKEKKITYEIYDEISLEKSASVFDMLYTLLGEDQFFRSLNKYLKTFAYSSVTYHQFWSYLHQFKRGVFLKIWTTKTGIPVVSVERKNNGGQFKLTQERLREFNNSYNYKTERDYWKIPIIYSYDLKSNEYPSIWLDRQSKIIDLKVPKKWLKINRDFYFYYRTDYKSDILIELTEILKSDIDSFSVKDRMGLIYDAFAMVSLGRQPVKYAFDLFEFVREEKDFCVLSAFFSKVDYVQQLTRGHEDARELFDKYVLGFSNPMVEKLGFGPIDDEFTRMLQILAIRVSVSFGDKETIEKAGQLFSSYLKNETQIPRDILPHLGCAYVMKIDSSEFDRMTEEMLSSQYDFRLFSMYLQSLSCYSDSQKLYAILERIISDVDIDRIMIPYILAYMSQTKAGSSAALQFFGDKFELIDSIYTKLSFTILPTVTTFFKSYQTQKEYDYIVSILQKRQTTSYHYRFEQGLEYIKENMHWIERNMDDLKKYLSK